MKYNNYMKYNKNGIKKSKYFIVKKKLPKSIELYNYNYIDYTIDFIFDLCTIGSVGYIVYNLLSPKQM
jgi:hypothetical protein